MNARNTLLAVLFAAAVTGSRAVPAAAALPPYTPKVFVLPKNAGYITPEGAVSVIGYNDMAEMLRALGQRFTALHPGIRFDWNLPGTKAAPAALAAGTSAFAPMGAPMTPAQLAAYEKVTHAPPLVFRIAHASLNPLALSGPLAVFVRRDNPLDSLTLEELAAIFSGTDSARGLRPCGVEREAALGLFFRERVLGNHTFAAGYVGYGQSAEVVKSVAEDPRAIGFAAAMRATPGVKMIALAEHTGEPGLVPTEETLASGRYPLDRHLLICARRPLEPISREFLRFILARDGQQIIASGTLGYLPLSASEVAAELAKLTASN